MLLVMPVLPSNKREVLAKSTSPVGTQKSHGTRLPINGKGEYIKWKD